LSDKAFSGKGNVCIILTSIHIEHSLVGFNHGVCLQLNANNNDDKPPSSSHLRIAFCLPELKSPFQSPGNQPTDASYIQQEYIAEGLRARGHNLTFLAQHKLDEVVYSNDQHELQAVPRTWSGSRWFDIVSRFTWRMQRLMGVPFLNVFTNYRIFDACLQCLPGHDLVYERNGLYKAGVAMACKRLRLPYILFFDADEILEYDFMGKPITGLLRWRAKELVRYNQKIADCIICVSEQAKIRLMTTWRVPAKKIVVLPNGVDVQRFQPDPEARSLIRTSLGIDINPLIIFVGNFYKWHDITTLLDAFSQVLITYPGALLLLIGDGSERLKMMKYAIDLGIGNAVKFTGLIPHSEVPNLLSAADIAVAPYPALMDNFWLSPMKLFEYMASGAAIIASGVGQITEVVKDCINGLLVPPGDVSSMVVALKRLIDDAPLRLRLSQQARIDAVQKHSWERYNSRLEHLCEAVIARQPFDQI
jgi:glycosyltransferase involved in cell wall biosynthesis